MSKFSIRTTAVACALGATAIFAVPATAGAQTPPIEGPDTGSLNLGSLSAVFVDGADEAFGNFIGGSLGENGSLVGMEGSATGSIANTESQKALRNSLVDGSSEGSVGSIGDIAAQLNPDELDGPAQGSATASSQGSGMLKGVDSASVTGSIKSASIGLENLPAANPSPTP